MSGEEAQPALSPSVSNGGKAQPAVEREVSNVAAKKLKQEPPNVTYGRCVHNTAEALNMSYQEYVWVESAKISKDELREIMTAWGLEAPNLILNITGPASGSLIDPPSMMYPPLQDTIKELIACKAMAKTGQWSEPDVDHDVVGDSSLFSLVCDKLEENIIQTLMALLSACEQTNSWIQVNWNGACYPDYLVAKALSRCQARPVIIALIGRDWYTGMEESWSVLQGAATEMHSKLKLSDLPIAEVPYKKPSSYDNNWPVGYATHYFFVKPMPDDNSWNPFPLEWLGPSGTMFISGGGSTEGTILESIKALRPTILLKYTGRATDFYSFAAETVMDGGCTSADQAMKAMAETYPFWYDRSGNWTDGGGYIYGQISSDLAPSYMSQLVATYSRDQQRFRSAIVVLDAWKTKPEAALRKLSACFAVCSSQSVSSLDAGGLEANEETILFAWTLHDTLEANCARMAWRVNFLTCAAIALSMVTTTISVCCTYVQTMTGTQWADEILGSSAWGASNVTMVILPAVGGLMLQILSRFHYVKKWGVMHMAKQQIESEIFKYRTNAGEYDASVTTIQMDKKGDDADKKPAGKSVHMARDIFSLRVADKFGSVLSHALNDDSLHFTTDIYQKRKRDHTADSSWEDFAQPLLQDDAEKSRVSMAVPVTPKNMVARTKRPTTISSDDDDGYSTLGGEEYFETRTLPLLQKIQRDAPKLSRRMQYYEMATLILSLFSTLLAALGMKVWIPITISLGTGLTSYMHYEALQGRLSAANVSLADLAKLVGHWTSLGVVEKRTRSMKTLLVHVTEDAVVRQSSAYISGITPGSFQDIAKAGSSDSNDGQGKGKGKEQDEKKGK